MRLILLYVFKPNLQTHPYVKPLDRVKFLSKSEPGSPAERSHVTSNTPYLSKVFRIATLLRKNWQHNRLNEYYNSTSMQTLLVCSSEKYKYFVTDRQCV